MNLSRDNCDLCREAREKGHAGAFHYHDEDPQPEPVMWLMLPGGGRLEVAQVLCQLPLRVQLVDGRIATVVHDELVFE